MGDLRAGRVEGFVEVRRAAGYTDRLSERALAPLLGYLRGLGVTPTPPERAAVTPAESLVEEYRTWLRSERGLAESSVEVYRVCCVGEGRDLRHPDSMRRRRASAPTIERSAFAGYRFPPEVIVLAVRLVPALQPVVP